MNSGYGAPPYGGNMMGYATVETLLDDVSRQMASSNLAKYARGSTGQRPVGGSMRIVKPNSTSNSPRGSIGLGRRRTVMTDRRRIGMVDLGMATQSGFISSDGPQIPTRSNRPVSWHPSSEMASQPLYPSPYQVPALNPQADFHIFDLPPTPAVYSGYASPDSNFSPLSMPYAAYEQHYPYTEAPISHHSNEGYSSVPPAAQVSTPYSSAPSGDIDPSMYSHFDWGNFATNGFENSTAPPTPENFLPIQHPDSTLPTDDAIPYHSLSDSEPEGEILQGLGLYDVPEISKSSPSDLQLDNYRALVMSQLLGPAYRKVEPEPVGKGLKLEETWNPPPSDDEGDEEDDEQDGEAEDDLEVEGSEQSLGVKDTLQDGSGIMDATNFLPNGGQSNHGLQPYSGNAWL